MKKSIIMFSVIFVLLSMLAMPQRSSAQAEPFLGQLTLVPYNFAPRGWALCQGQLLPISQNAALFSLLGTTYGGNGSTTFALPDLRGRVPIGSGQGPGLTNMILGDRRGGDGHPD